MEIYLLRHGAAENALPGNADADRRLTEEGKRKTAAVVRTARGGGLGAALVISSPYARAVETARIAMAELGVDRELTQTPSLVPYGSPEVVWRELRNYREEPAVLLAGHEPLLGALAAYLLNSPALVVEMKKSAMVRIDTMGTWPTPRGVLRWMLTAGLAE